MYYIFSGPNDNSYLLRRVCKGNSTYATQYPKPVTSTGSYLYIKYWHSSNPNKHRGFKVECGGSTLFTTSPPCKL